MSTTKHLPLEKFEAIDMSLDDAIAPGKRASGAHRSIIARDAIDKADEFSHLALFCPLEPGVQGLSLAFSEQHHKFLAQEVDAAQFLTALADVLNLLLLNGRLFLRWQNHQKRSAPRGKATSTRLGSQAWFAGFPLSGLGRKVCSPLGDQAPE